MYVSRVTPTDSIVRAVLAMDSKRSCDDGCKYNKCGYCELYREDLKVYSGGIREYCEGFYGGEKIDAKAWRESIKAAIEKAKKQMATDGWEGY